MTKIYVITHIIYSEIRKHLENIWTHAIFEKIMTLWEPVSSDLETTYQIQFSSVKYMYTCWYETDLQNLLSYFETRHPLNSNSSFPPPSFW